MEIGQQVHFLLRRPVNDNIVGFVLTKKDALVKTKLIVEKALVISFDDKKACLLLDNKTIVFCAKEYVFENEQEAGSKLNYVVEHFDLDEERPVIYDGFDLVEKKKSEEE